MKELSLNDSQKISLAAHHQRALKEKQVLQWVDELCQAKKRHINELEKQREEIKGHLVELETYKNSTVQMMNTELQELLNQIIRELQLAPNSKIQLVFEQGVPKLIQHD